MSVGGEPGHLHTEVSERSGFRYFFYDKHHGRGGPEVAQWATDVSNDEEFGIFDQADLHEIRDNRGNLYGLRVVPGPAGEILYLGTLRQQVAKFPIAREGTPWHGYPLAPLEHRPKVPQPPPRALPNDALQRMVEVGLLDNRQRKRLLKGRNI
jgi:hypothetical protein